MGYEQSSIYIFILNADYSHKNKQKSCQWILNSKYLYFRFFLYSCNILSYIQMVIIFK